MTYQLAQRRYAGRGFTSMRVRPGGDGGLADGPSPVGVGICAAAGSAMPSDKAARLTIAIDSFSDIAAILAEPLTAA
jgi:hypothetical protein